MFDPGPGFENLLEEEHLSRQERLFCDIFLHSEFSLDLMSARSTLGDGWWYKKSPVCGREIHLLNLISRVTSRLKEVPNFGERCESGRNTRAHAKTRTTRDAKGLPNTGNLSITLGAPLARGVLESEVSARFHIYAQLLAVYQNNLSFLLFPLSQTVIWEHMVWEGHKINFPLVVEFVFLFSGSVLKEFGSHTLISDQTRYCFTSGGILWVNLLVANPKKFVAFAIFEPYIRRGRRNNATLSVYVLLLELKRNRYFAFQLPDHRYLEQRHGDLFPSSP